MRELGYDINMMETKGKTPEASGNRIAQTIIDYGLQDGANEQQDYASQNYKVVNPRLDPWSEGNPRVKNPNRWQQLDLPDFVSQSGRQSDQYPPFVGPEWGWVKPFALTEKDAIIKEREGHQYKIYLDPGPPPTIIFNSELFKSGFEQVIEWASHLDPSNGLVMDISPAARGNNTLGTNDGTGYKINPVTNQPYKSQWVFAGDYFRVLAEFWADGPSSETPPGHWFVILNYVSDQPVLKKQFGGQGRLLDDLEWDVKTYLTLGGAMHDAAIAAWSNKGWYDYTRPISAIRYLCDQGQSSNPSLTNYNPNGIGLKPGVIELITNETIKEGSIHAHLHGEDNQNLGKIAIKSWLGPSKVKNPREDVAGVGWMLCGNWWPYQRPNFVTPPFAGYVSGHSTYSRAAAEVLTKITGSKYFPGGYSHFKIPQDIFLVFEKGPTKPFSLQWATYQDAADECSISRIYGGIHPPQDDIPGRLMGLEIGNKAFDKAISYFSRRSYN